MINGYLAFLGHHYPTAHYISENGSEPAESGPLSEHDLRLVRDICITFIPEAKQCFYNAQFVSMVASSKGLSERMKYVEGYVVKSNLPIPVHHAWVELDGKVIDLTLVTTEHSTQELERFYHGEDLPRKDDLSDRILGEIPEGWAYYGVRFDIEEIAQDFIARGKSFSKIDDWENGWPLLNIKKSATPTKPQRR